MKGEIWKISNISETDAIFKERDIVQFIKSRRIGRLRDVERMGQGRQNSRSEAGRKTRRKQQGICEGWKSGLGDAWQEQEVNEDKQWRNSWSTHVWLKYRRSRWRVGEGGR